MSDYKNLPKNIKRFAFLGWDHESTSGDEYIGSSIFHSKSRKFYVNSRTGQWQDKYSGHSGNFTTYLRLWQKYCIDRFQLTDEQLKEFAKERGILLSLVKKAGIFRGLFMDGPNWACPVRNAEGKLNTVIKWKGPGSRLIWCTGSNMVPFGLDNFPQEDEGKLDRLYWAEGYWDQLALTSLLKKSDNDFSWAVLGVPGAEAFKPEWAAYAKRARTNIFCYDNDGPGEDGTKRAIEMVEAYGIKNTEHVRWPSKLPTGYDVRDFRKDKGTEELLSTLVVPFGKKATTKAETKKRKYSKRPSWDETISSYAEWLHMSDEHVDTLRVIYAVALSNKIPGTDYLWIHIVAAAGSGKTELLMSLGECDDVISRSSVTAHSLVSGWQSSSDPSLVPQLIGNVFILKDFTEILEMGKNERDQVYNVLRGAYDGKVEREFGQGIKRLYKGHFSMLTGVTQAIDRENSTALGERFLKFRLRSKRDSTETIMDALSNVGSEERMREALTTAARDFLTVKVDFSSIPGMEADETKRIIALAKLTAKTRQSVERDTYRRERVLYRSEPEVATRLAKQLKRLRIGLGLCHDPYQLTEDDYRIVKKCALDTGTAYVMDIVQQLRSSRWQTVAELSKSSGVPPTTLREILDDLEITETVQSKRQSQSSGPGRPNKVFALTEEVTRLMKDAGL